MSAPDPEALRKAADEAAELAEIKRQALQQLAAFLGSITGFLSDHLNISLDTRNALGRCGYGEPDGREVMLLLPAAGISSVIIGLSQSRRAIEDLLL